MIPLVFILFILLVEAVGGIGARFTARGVSEWYPTLAKPPLTPPGWLFGPVWTVLYFLMGTAAFLVWMRRRQPGAKLALFFFFLQLFLNGIWSPVFFGMRSVGGGLAVLVLLFVAVVVTIMRFWRISHAAAILLFPYFLWLCFALYLNIGLYTLNR